MNWETGADICTPLCINRPLKGINCRAQGTLLSALWGPKWEGNPEVRDKHTCVTDSTCCTAENNATL